MNSVFRWLQREAVPEQHRELYAKIHELQETLEKRTKEHQEQLATVRIERDRVYNEMRDLEEWFNAVSEAFEQDVPSVFDQAKASGWKGALFDFGKAKKPGVDYFNPSLVRRKDGLWLITRRAKEWPRFQYGLNDILCFKLNAEHVPEFGIKPPITSLLNGEHFEDPRAIHHNGETWLGCCNFVVYPTSPVQTWTGAHQILCQLADDWSCIKRHDPIYGGNGGSTSVNTGNEKNWLWFFHKGQLHMVYMTKPHTVVPFNPFVEAGKPYITNSINPLWHHGEPRGGTPPVLVGDEYWSFFHSSTPWVGKKRRYHMGAYAFEAKPPFRITRMSSLPLLSGSKRDPWAEGKPLVVFPNGAILENGVWFIAFGINDLTSGWVEIPHRDLEQITKVLPNDENTLYNTESSTDAAATATAASLPANA